MPGSQFWGTVYERMSTSSPISPARTGVRPDERVQIQTRPALVSIVLRSAGRLLVCAVLFGLGLAFFAANVYANWALVVSEAAIALALGTLVVEAIRRSCTVYVLTDRRIFASSGILTRFSTELGLSGVRHIAVRCSLAERLLGLGTIAVATAGAEGYEVIWRYVDQAHALADQIRQGLLAWSSPPPGAPPIGAIALSATASEAMMSMMGVQPSSRAAPQGAKGIPVIGLSGGIGAGKSTVARMFEKLGCYVVDSDARAKAALDRPEVRDELVKWWGDQVLTPQGRIDRSKVAQIIFSDPQQRARLESLVHPLVRQDRAKLIEESAKFWPKAVIVDAPLLFEAGVDKECDAVVFVDAPAEERLRRVRDSRGWDDFELARREASQWPLERKRAASGYVVQNVGPEADVIRAVGDILARIRLAKDSPPVPNRSKEQPT